MARACKKAKWLALAHKKRCFFHYLFHFKLFLRSRLVLGSQVINWSKKIGRLMRKTQQKIQQRSVSWFRRDVPAISSLLLMSSICFSSGALHTFLFLHESLSAIFHFVKCKQNSFSCHCNVRLSAVKVWDVIENRACPAVVHGFSKPWTTFECIYTNTFTSKVSHGLDKPIPKPLGQDKPRLELALGCISHEHRFFTIYTGCLRLM